jgi:hypothetical protein
VVIHIKNFDLKFWKFKNEFPNPRLCAASKEQTNRFREEILKLSKHKEPWQEKEITLDTKYRYFLEKIILHNHILVYNDNVVCTFFVNDKIVFYTQEQLAFLLLQFQKNIIDENLFRTLLRNKHLIFKEEDEKPSPELSKEQEERIINVSKLLIKISNLATPENNFKFIMNTVLIYFDFYFKQLKEKNEKIPYSLYMTYIMFFKARKFTDIKGYLNKQHFENLSNLVLDSYDKKDIAKKLFLKIEERLTNEERSSKDDLIKLSYLERKFEKFSPCTRENFGIFGFYYMIVYFIIILPIKTWWHGPIDFEKLEQYLTKECKPKEFEDAKEHIEKLVEAREAATKLVVNYNVNPLTFKNPILKNPELYPSLKKQESSI